MIYVGRALQGIAISFATASVPIYNSEVNTSQNPIPPLISQEVQRVWTALLIFADIFTSDPADYSS